MAIMESLDRAKEQVSELKRKWKFRKANKARENATELQYSLQKCRGELEVCRKDFQRAVKAQSKNIRDGRAAHEDTLVQEQILWDASIGYMLVKDAIFALKSVNSYDTVSHAYDMLDAAMRQITGKKEGIMSLFRKNKDERTEYGFITSDAAIKGKAQLLEGIYEKVIETGDIDACLELAAYPEDREAARRAEAGRNGLSETDRYAAVLDSLPDDAPEAEIDPNELGSMMDIHPPKQ